MTNTEWMINFLHVYLAFLKTDLGGCVCTSLMHFNDCREEKSDAPSAAH